MANDWMPTNLKRPKGLFDTDMVEVALTEQGDNVVVNKAVHIVWSENPFWRRHISSAAARLAIPDEPVTEAVHHPKHYNAHPSGIECIDVVRHMNFNLGNVVKYLWRAGEKDPAKHLEDLKKAAWYLNDEIERLSK